MDPQAAWDAMLDAYCAKNPDDVQEYATALREWLAKRGFPPDTGGGRALGDDWHRCLAEAGVALALQYVETWKGGENDDA